MTKSMRVWARATVVGLVAAMGFANVVGGSGNPASASARDGRDVGAGTRYLALGDSIPFGYSPLLEDPWDPTRFIGYPELIAQQTGMTTTNLACPGQTAQALVSRTAPDAGCFEAREEARKEGYKLLHTDYRGTQLAAALEAARSDQPPSLISIQGGGNEVSMCLDADHPKKCLDAALPKVTRSLRTAATKLRGADDEGRVVLVGYHLVSDIRAQLIRLNSAIARAANQSHVAFADTAVPFDRYARRHGGDLCTTGLLIAAPDGSCDLHPTQIGAQIYANAVLKSSSAAQG